MYDGPWTTIQPIFLSGYEFEVNTWMYLPKMSERHKEILLKRCHDEPHFNGNDIRWQISNTGRHAIQIKITVHINCERGEAVMHYSSILEERTQKLKGITNEILEWIRNQEKKD